MNTVHDLLDKAERVWRETLRISHPTIAGIEVHKAKPNPLNKRDWTFYTTQKQTLTGAVKDGKKVTDPPLRRRIYMDIYKPENIKRVFENVVVPLYQNAYTQKTSKEGYGAVFAEREELSKRLIHDTLVYLFFHEAFHAKAPWSRKDAKFIDRAIYDGIKAAEPKISNLDAICKVVNVQNAVYDVIDDTLVYNLTTFSPLEKRLREVIGENRELAMPTIPSLADGIIATFDTLEMNRADIGEREIKSLFYPLTRLMYGLLYTRNHNLRRSLVQFFESRLQRLRREDIYGIISDALCGIVDELDKDQQKGLPIIAYHKAVKDLTERYSMAQTDEAQKIVVQTMNETFSNEITRYSAITGFIKPLSKFVSIKNEGSREELSEMDFLGNVCQTLENLAEMLGESGDKLLSDIINKPYSGVEENPYKEKIKAIAADTYYKKHAKPLKIKAPATKIQQSTPLTREELRIISTHYLSTEELVFLPLEKIMAFLDQTGISQLTQLHEFQWQYDVYEKVVIEEFDYTFKQGSIKLPDNIVLHLDSSRSMGMINESDEGLGSDSYVGKNVPYDKLMHLVYGMLKPLAEIAEETGQKVNVLSANFSHGTTLCETSGDIQEVYANSYHAVKQNILKYQGSGTVYSPKAFDDIRLMLVSGNTVHVYITDGGLQQTEDETFEKIKEVTNDPQSIFVYFQIGTEVGFGKRIRELSEECKRVKYHAVTDLSSLQSSHLEVVLGETIIHEEK